MIESLEIFEKYETSEDKDSLPMDVDYGIITVFFYNAFIEANDLDRLKELGWEIHQSSSNGKAHYFGNYEINEVDKGDYEFYLHL